MISEKTKEEGTMKNILIKWNEISLVKRIIGGLIVGILLGLVVPQFTVISLLGDLFVGALKAVAPLLDRKSVV